MVYDFPETESTIKVYDTEIYFNNSNIVDDSQFGISKEYFYYDSNGNGIVFAIERNTNSRIYYNVYYAQYILHYDIIMKIYYESCLVLKMFSLYTKS